MHQLLLVFLFLFILRFSKYEYVVIANKINYSVRHPF